MTLCLQIKTKHTLQVQIDLNLLINSNRIQRHAELNEAVHSAQVSPNTKLKV